MKLYGFTAAVSHISGFRLSGIPPEDHPIQILTERGLLLRDKTHFGIITKKALMSIY
jgi:hypothetical protein